MPSGSSWRAAPVTRMRPICGASGLGRTALERLAEADALRSLKLDRRRGLWALKALGESALAAVRRRQPSAEDGPLQKPFGVLRDAPRPSPGAPQDDEIFDGIKNDRHPEELAQPASRRTHDLNPAKRSEIFRRRCCRDAARRACRRGLRDAGLTIKRHPLAFLRAELAQGGARQGLDLATLRSTGASRSPGSC